jgi:proteasome-associated ATPase
MRQQTEPGPDPMVEAMLRRLFARGGAAPGVEERLGLAAAIRRRSPEGARQLDRRYLEEMDGLWEQIRRVQRHQEELEQVHRRLTAPPWHAAVFLGPAPAEGGSSALVAHNNTPRVVSVSDDVDLATLAAGDEVLLGQELNVIVGRVPAPLLASGETAVFDRLTGDGRMIVRSRDEEVVVRVAAGLGADALRPGDKVRWNRGLGMAFERLEASRGEQLFLEETPADSFADIGGLDRQIAELQRVIRLHYEHPATVARYRLPRKSSVLLAGPPGTGKTLMARALANWLGTVSRSGRSRFMNVKPAGLHSMWYAQSEANYREAFRVAREAGAQDPGVPVVMFFDEVDAIGGARGDSLHRVDDRVLTAFMTELDGLESRGDILVVAATNRRDALDPALLRPGRLGDVVLDIPRPNRHAAADIFARHLAADLPYDGGDGRAGRPDLIEAAVSRLYAPNGLGDLATVTLRDGRRRPVLAGDLVSGATIAKICQAAVERACHREAEGGRPGVRLTDLLEVVDAEFESVARALTPANCRRYLDDLPQDVDVVRVEPVTRRLRREHRFLRIA